MIATEAHQQHDRMGVAIGCSLPAATTQPKSRNSEAETMIGQSGAMDCAPRLVTTLAVTWRSSRPLSTESWISELFGATATIAASSA